MPIATTYTQNASENVRKIHAQGIATEEHIYKYEKKGLEQEKKSVVVRDYSDNKLTRKRRNNAYARKNGNTDKQKKHTGKLTLRNMTYEQMMSTKNDLLAAKNYLGAKKFLERMLKLCDDMHEIATLMVEYADVLYALNKKVVAEQAYSKFAQLYPGHPQVEYALYRALECAQAHILSADRDQEATKRTLELADTFLEREMIFTEHREHVREIRNFCLQRLVDHELVVCNFYLSQDNFSPIERRLNHIKEQYNDISNIDDQIEAYKQKIAARKQEIEELKELPFYMPAVRMITASSTGVPRAVRINKDRTTT